MPTTILTTDGDLPAVAPSEPTPPPPPIAPPPARRWLHILGFGAAAHLLARGHRCFGTQPNRSGRATLYLFTKTAEAIADAKTYERAASELRGLVDPAPAPRTAMAEAMTAAAEARR